MKNASYPYHALARVYRTAVAVSALILSSSFAYAADPPVPRGNVSVTVNPTTGYYSTSNTTLRLPDGVRATPSAGASTVTKYAGGLQQSIPTGITIDAIKKSAPLPTVVRATTQSVKNAATGCLKSARCNVGLMLAGAGLQRLFDGLDWVMGEGGQIQRVSTVPSTPEEGGGVWCINNQYCAGSPEASLASLSAAMCPNSWQCPYTYLGQLNPNEARAANSDGMGLNIMRNSSKACSPPYSFNDDFHCVMSQSSVLTDSDIASGVQNNYVPEPSDWPSLTPELELTDVEITSAPTLKGEPITTTVYDADGVPHEIKETNIWYDFDIRDNPSSSPSLDLKMREETKTYKNGALTGTTTTETTQPAVVGGGGKAPTVEIPTDCDLFPTACAWMEWTKEEPTEPEDNLPDLLREVPIVNKTYTITGGAAACPAPLVLNLSQFGSREVSYQPLCDLASTMKFLYLALMSFAAAVLLHRSINRV